MDLNKTELVAVEQASEKARYEEVSELDELQLTLVGGGIGETIL